MWHVTRSYPLDSLVCCVVIDAVSRYHLVREFDQFPSHNSITGPSQDASMPGGAAESDASHGFYESGYWLRRRGLLPRQLVQDL